MDQLFCIPTLQTIRYIQPYTHEKQDGQHEEVVSGRCSEHPWCSPNQTRPCHVVLSIISLVQTFCLSQLLCALYNITIDCVVHKSRANMVCESKCYNILYASISQNLLKDLAQHFSPNTTTTCLYIHTPISTCPLPVWH